MEFPNLHSGILVILPDRCVPISAIPYSYYNHAGQVLVFLTKELGGENK